MQVVRNLKGALTSLRLVDDSFANDKSILESLKNKQNLIIISFFQILATVELFKFRMFNQQKKDKKTFCHGLRPMVWIAAMLA